MVARVFGGRRAKAREAACALRGWMSGPRLVCVFALSGALNAMQLSTSLFVLHLYDRVLPSQSLAALAELTALVMALVVGFTLVDLLRGRVLCRAGFAFVRGLDRGALDGLGAGRPDGLAALGDAERVGRFMTNAGPAALFDLLWLPACLVAVFLLHPVLGLFAGVGVLVLAVVAVGAEKLSREGRQGMAGAGRRRLALASAWREVRRWPQVAGRDVEFAGGWRDACEVYDRLRAEAAERVLVAGAVAKGLRLVLQFGGLGLGALLVIEGAMSAGGLIAAALIMGRTFAVLDGGLAHWQGFVAAWESYGRLVRSPPPHPEAICDRFRPLPAGER